MQSTHIVGRLIDNKGMMRWKGAGSEETVLLWERISPRDASRLNRAHLSFSITYLCPDTTHPSQNQRQHLANLELARG
jgi:hypothetical protein